MSIALRGSSALGSGNDADDAVGSAAGGGDTHELMENASDMAMACLYGLQALVCLGLLIQLKRRRERKKIRAWFFVLCGCAGALRCLWFGIPDSIFSQGYRPENRRPTNFTSRPFLLNSLQFALYSIPNCIYAVNWIMLLCFWSSVLHLLFSQRSTTGGGGGGFGLGGMATGDEDDEEEEETTHGARDQRIPCYPDTSFGGSANVTADGTLTVAPTAHSRRLIAYRPAARFLKWSALMICCTQLLLFGSLFVFDFMYVVIATCAFLCILALFALVAYVVYAWRIVKKLRPVYKYVLLARSTHFGAGAAPSPRDEHAHLFSEALSIHAQNQQQQHLLGSSGVASSASSVTGAGSALSAGSARGGGERRTARGVDDTGGLDSDARDRDYPYPHPSAQHRSSAGRSQLDQPQPPSRPGSHSNSPSRAGAFSPTAHAAHQVAAQLSQPILHVQQRNNNGGRDNRTVSAPSVVQQRLSQQHVSTAHASNSDELSYVPHDDDEEDEEDSEEHCEGDDAEAAEEDDDEADTTAEDEIADVELSDSEGAVHAAASSAGEDVPSSAVVRSGSSSNTSGRSSRQTRGGDEDELAGPPDRRVSPGFLVSGGAAHPDELFVSPHVLPAPHAAAHAQLHSPVALSPSMASVAASNKQRLFAMQQRQQLRGSGGNTPADRSSPMLRQPSPPIVSGGGKSRLAVVTATGSPINVSGSSSSSAGGRSAGAASPEPYSADGTLRPQHAHSRAGSLGGGGGGGKANPIIVKVAPVSSSSSVPPRVGSPGAQLPATGGHVRLHSHGGGGSPPMIFTNHYAYGTSVAASSAADLAEEQLAWYAYRQTRKIVLLSVCVVLCSGARIASSVIEMHFTWKQVQADQDNANDGEAVSYFPSMWWIFVDSYYVIAELLASSVVAYLLTQRSLDVRPAATSKSAAQAATVAAWNPAAPHWGAAHHANALSPGYGYGYGYNSSAQFVPGARQHHNSYGGGGGLMGTSAPSAPPRMHQTASMLHSHHAHALVSDSGYSIGSNGAWGSAGGLSMPSSSLPSSAGHLYAWQQQQQQQHAQLGPLTSSGNLSALQARLLGGGPAHPSGGGSSTLASSYASVAGGNTHTQTSRIFTH